MSLSSIIFVSGTVLLLHSAYSCLHYRSLLQGLEEAVSGISTDILENTGSSGISVPPADVWIEALLGMILIFFAELIRPGSALQPVVTTAAGRKPRQLAAPAYITRDFDIYNTRARALTKAD